MPSRIVIIPARGGSKRIPKKNIKLFCGIPMIGHSINVARKSGLFDVIHVSTEDAEIFKIASDLGEQPAFMRPKSLADDHTPIMPVLKFVVEEYANRGQHFDQVWLLMACSPLIDETDLEQAEQVFISGKGLSPVLAVTEFPVPIEWAYDMNDQAFLTPTYPGAFAIRSQDIPKRYFDAGSFVIYPKNQIKDGELQGSDIGFIGYILPRDKSVDIDSDEDWRLAEHLFLKSNS